MAMKLILHELFENKAEEQKRQMVPNKTLNQNQCFHLE